MPLDRMVGTIQCASGLLKERVVVCSNCGAQTLPGDEFCDECGSPVGAGCASCGFVNRVGARFFGWLDRPLRAPRGYSSAGKIAWFLGTPVSGAVCARAF